MASRKVTVNITCKVILDVDEGLEIGDIINDMEYGFVPQEGASLVDEELVGFNVTDSR